MKEALKEGKIPDTRMTTYTQQLVSSSMTLHNPMKGFN
jgi:hypothetical protein